MDEQLKNRVRFLQQVNTEGMHTRPGDPDIRQHTGGIPAFVMERAAELPSLPQGFSEHRHLWLSGAQSAFDRFDAQ